jgi:hypothetical protein
MAQAKRKNITAFAKTADAELFKLHDKFCKAYAAVLHYRAAGGGGAGSVDGASKEEKLAQRKWERACDDATEKARAVIDAPAVTLEGMLMKIHIAGFNFTYTKPDTFSAPYQSKICKNSHQDWEPAKSNETDEIALIVSLRNDLQRFSGRRT